MRPSAEPQDNSAPVLIEHDLLVVGVPVFNEARYLEETLQSLERQSWSDFAVLIADNASTDRSEVIARQFCDRDPRFHLYRHASNVGGLANFKYLRDVTQSPLFMWLGAHDVLHPDFLSEAIAAYRADPSITVTFSWMRMVATDGSTECLLKNDIAARMPSGAMRRYLHAYRYVYGYEINHLLRRSAFDDFDFRETLSWDLIFLAHLAFKGPFVCIPKELYSIRNVHPRDRESEHEVMERLTGAKGRGANVDATLAQVTDDFTGLAAGRAGWKLFRAMLKALVLHRLRPGGTGLLSNLLHATAPLRTFFYRPFQKAR
jgi:glycosyltransferase involved in cell wall biosynthesis